jgi:hypothetical protein
VTATSLTEFGAKIEASDQREQCQAFDENGDRCPFKCESEGVFCPDCDEESALVTVADLRANRPGNHGVYHYRTTVKNILRDEYGFPARNALMLASSSVLSTCYVLEGRLAWAENEDRETFSVCGHEYRVERGRELLEKIRTQVSSSTFREKWDSAGLAVGRGKVRCSNPRETGTVCSFHEELDEDEIRIDNHLSEFGPAGNSGESHARPQTEQFCTGGESA